MVSRPSDPPSAPRTLGDARAKLRRRQIVGGALFALMAVALAFLGITSGDEGSLVVLAGMCGALSALMFWTATRYRKLAVAVSEVNGAFVHLVAGREKEAEATLASMIARAGDQPYVLRAINVQRTILAMRRGQMEAAVDWSTRSLGGTMQFATRLTEGVQAVEGRALRSLALASLGRGEEALADARAVEGSPMAGGSALARVSLARAVLLAKSGRADELLAHYAAEGDALVEELWPRERALSRALRRMGQPRARSVYREAAVVDEPEADAARDWVRKIAPDAARFVPSAAHAPPPGEQGGFTAPPLGPPAPRASTAIGLAAAQVAAGARRRRVRLGGKAFALWLGIVAVAAGMWAFLAPDPHAPRHGHAPPSPAATVLSAPAVVSAVFLLLVVALVWNTRRRYQQRLQTLQQAPLALARSEDPEAKKALEALARNGGVALAPNAFLALARDAMRRGDLDGALQACVDGLGVATSTLQARAAHQDIVLPDLLATYAFALVTAGRAAEAREALATIERDHPVFPYRARAIFRVELIDAVKRGDLLTAARLVAAREPEMLVEIRVDLLGEIASAAAVGGLHDEAAEALRSELAAMPRVAAWVEQVAPGLSARIGREHSIRVATPFHSYEDDTIRLDDEAAQLLALGARRPRS